MRIAVISDSHQGMLHLERCVQYCKTEKVDQIFHLGDVLEDVRYLQKQIVQIPIAAVAGNCDAFSRHQRELRLTLEGKRFLLVHGDKYGVKYGYDRLSYYAEEAMVDVAVFGQTHRAFAGYLGSALLLNPGALKNGSMCMLEVNEKGVEPHFVDIDQWYNEQNK